MTTYVAYDDVSVPLIPADAAIIGVYIDGRYENEAAVKAKFPKAELVTIATSANDDADALDVEAGDATIAEVYAWLTRQLKRGVKRPVIYISVSQVDTLMATMTANRFARSQFRLWSAHYGAGEHICGPSTCKLCKTACDWTQFTDTANGSSLDESDLGADPASFAPPAATAVTPPVTSAKPVVTVPADAVAMTERDIAKVEQDIAQVEAYVKAHE